MRKVKALTLFEGSIGHYEISPVHYRKAMLLSQVDIYIASKACTVFIAFLEFFSTFDDVILTATLILIRLPGMNWWIKLRFNGAILIYLINADKFRAILIELLDLVESRIEGGFKGPINVQDTTVSTQL